MLRKVLQTITLGTMGTSRLTPYMHPAEFAQLLAIIESCAPARVLEWGSGGSTKALLARCPFIERFVSLEHVSDWFTRVQQEVQDSRLELFLIEPDRPPSRALSAAELKEWENQAEVEPEIMARYIAFPATLETEFDFILVDGRARRFCLEEGYTMLTRGGVMVIHDAQRVLYHDVLHELEQRHEARVVFLEPWHDGQICLIRKPESMSDRP